MSSDSADRGSSASGTAPELVVVMPAYNEAACIAQVCRDWLAALSGIQGTILLVVDDGSVDDTGKILDDLSQSCSSLMVVHQENAGHGAALLRGYLAAFELRPSWIFHANSDNQFAAEDLRKLWESRRSYRFILGFRAERQDSVHRILLSRALSVLNLLLFGCYVRDANTPFRLIRSDVLAELLRMVPRQCLIPNIFLSVLAKKMDAGFCETPVAHLARAAGRSSLISWRLVSLSLRAFFQLLELRLRLWKQPGLVRDLRERLKRVPTYFRLRPLPPTSRRGLPRWPAIPRSPSRCFPPPPLPGSVSCAGCRLAAASMPLSQDRGRLLYFQISRYLVPTKTKSRGKRTPTNRVRAHRSWSSFKGHPSVQELMTEQGTGPITDVSVLHGDFWPEEESIEDFLEALHEWRGHKRTDPAA